MNINANDEVEICLTKKGIKILYQNGLLSRQTVRDGKTYYNSELWDIMNIFGSHLGNGAEIPFETTMTITQKRG